MNEQIFSNNVKNGESTIDTEKSDYKNLIFRLKEISQSIALLEKQYLDKF